MRGHEDGFMCSFHANGRYGRTGRLSFPPPARVASLTGKTTRPVIANVNQQRRKNQQRQRISAQR